MQIKSEQIKTIVNGKDIFYKWKKMHDALKDRFEILFAIEILFSSSPVSLIAMKKAKDGNISRLSQDVCK